MSKLIIFPTRGRLLDARNTLLSTDEDGAFFTGNLTTVGAFEKELLSDVPHRRKSATNLERSLLLIKVLFETRIDLFSRIKRFKGFAGAMQKFFNELSAGLVSPADLMKIKGYAPGKEEAISDLYSRYSLELEKTGLNDAGIDRQALLEKLETAFTSPLLKFDEIELVDVYMFTPFRFELFRKISRRIPVTIVAPLPDNRRKAFGFIDTNLSKFENLGEDHGNLSIYWKEKKNSHLSYIADNLFEAGRKPFLSPTDKDTLERSVKIVSCASRYREVEEIGTEIAGIKRKKRTDWTAFSIVLRDIRLYGSIIEDVFRRYSIPFSLKKGVSLSSTPAARALLALFETIDTGFSNENVSRLLTSPYFDRFARLRHDSIKKILLDSGMIDGSLLQWERSLSTAGKSMITGEVVELLHRLQSLSEQVTPGGFFVSLKNLLGYLRYGENLSDDFSHLLRDYHSCAQILEAVNETCSTVKKIGMERIPVGYEKLRDTIEGHIEGLTVNETGALDENCVQVQNAHDVIGASSPYVFVCGLHEKEFPVHADLRSILSESERKAFNKAHRSAFFRDRPHLASGRRVFERTSDKFQEESLLFYQAITSATEKIFLTCSVRELDGSSLQRSQFIDDLLSIGEPHLTITTAPALAIERDENLLIDPEERLTKLTRDFFNRSGSTEKRVTALSKDPLLWSRFKRLRALVGIERKRDHFFFEKDPDEKIELANELTGFIPDAKERLKSVIVADGYGRYSPTSLENYGQCPYRYFARKLLDLGKVKEPAPELDVMGKGSLAHDILEQFYLDIIKVGGIHGTSVKKQKEILDSSCEKMFAKHEREGKTGDPALFKVEKTRTSTMLARFIKWDFETLDKEGYEPMAVEVSFEVYAGRFKKNANQNHPPLRVDIGGGETRYIIGKPDRIDVNKDQNAIRVVDYKTSANGSKYSKLTKQDEMGISSFQLASYMMMARNWAKNENFIDHVGSLSGGYYLLKATDPKKFSTLTGSSKNPFNSDPFLNETPAPQADNFIDRLGKAIRKIEGGEFHIMPKSCEFCEFIGLCRYAPAPGTSPEKSDEDE